MEGQDPKTEAPQRNLTFGEKAVGITFNPGGMPEVNRIKELSAALIDEIHNQRNIDPSNGEKQAQYTLAIRRIQEGQMWAVKSVTWQHTN
jgi:hypothetical protein